MLCFTCVYLELLTQVLDLSWTQVMKLVTWPDKCKKISNIALTFKWKILCEATTWNTTFWNWTRSYWTSLWTWFWEFLVSNCHFPVVELGLVRHYFCLDLGVGACLSWLGTTLDLVLCLDSGLHGLYFGLVSFGLYFGLVVLTGDLDWP